MRLDSLQGYASATRCQEKEQKNVALVGGLRAHCVVSNMISLKNELQNDNYLGGAQIVCWCGFAANSPTQNCGGAYGDLRGWPTDTCGKGDLELRPNIPRTADNQGGIRATPASYARP